MGRYRFSGCGPNGRQLCRWCGVETKAPRRTWCSDACVDEYRQLHDWAFARQRCKDRDQGVCQICGLDTELLEVRKRTFEMALGRTGPYSVTSEWWWYQERWWAAMVKLGFKRKRSVTEVDHIVARIDGGGNELSNLREICVPCHKKETAVLAKRRAANE